MGTATYDDKRWPLLCVTMPSAINDAELDAHHTKLSEYLNKKQTMGLLVDSRQMPPLSPEGRRKSAEFIKSHADVAKTHVAAVALVHSSIVQTHVLTAILWIVKPPVLLKVFNQLDAAEDWLREKLSAIKS